MMSTTMTIRLTADLKEKIDHLAQVTERSKSYVAVKALEEFVALNEWQINEVQLAVKEADAEDFADEQEIERVFEQWQ